MPSSCARSSSPRCTRSTTSARTPTAARFKGSRRAASPRSPSRGIIRTSFSRVYTVVGSFVAIGWRPGEIDGGNVYPFKVRREPKRNLRVWMNDGSEDQETNPGSWPLQNIQLANSLKMKGYDFHFSFGGGIAPRRAGRIRAARVPHLAVAGLRPGEDRAGLRAERRGESQTALPRSHLQPVTKSSPDLLISRSSV